MFSNMLLFKNKSRKRSQEQNKSESKKQKQQREGKDFKLLQQIFSADLNTVLIDNVNVEPLGSLSRATLRIGGGGTLVTKN